MESNTPTKEQLVDGLLKSLHYGDQKKADWAMIEQIETLVEVPTGTDLRDYLVTNVNFSRLFAALMQLIEPFAQMLNDIYTFLARYRSTARTAENPNAQHQELRQLIISEGVSEELQFDLEAFPTVEQRILDRRQMSRPRFDDEMKLNHNCSPLFLTEALLAFGYHENDARNHLQPCKKCEEAFKESFAQIFSQLQALIDSITDDNLNDLPEHLLSEVKRGRRDFDIANKRFQAGIHASESCLGYEQWKRTLHTFLQRFEWITTEETWFEEIEAFLRFFELPFWEKRSQFYEVWTLIHFLSRFSNAPVLNIQQGEWHLMYTRAEEPVAWVRTDSFELEVWFQRSLVGKTYSDTHVMPDIMVTGRSLRNGMRPEPLILIECKEREGESLSDIQRLASHYHNQVQAKRYIYCNYLYYLKPVGLRVYGKRGEIICDGFQPGGPHVTAVDKEFKRFINRRIKHYLSLH